MPRAGRNTAPGRTLETSAHNSGVQTGATHGSAMDSNQNIISQVDFGSGNSGLQAGVINGGLHGVTFHYSDNQSIFGSLIQGSQPLDTSTLEILARRAQVQAGRSVPRQLRDRCYAPYKTVRNRGIKMRLLQIAHVTKFLDRGFAEYFQVAVLSFGKQHAQKLLQDARKTIARMQNKQDDPDSADIGDLGHFCEQSAITSGDSEQRPPRFTVTQRRDEETLHYLQDALEIPYWEFMVDIFLGWKANSSALSGDVVLRVLHSTKLELLDGRRRLMDDMAALQGDDSEDIAPIIDGIDARIKVLDSLWDSASSNPHGTHYSLVTFLEQPLRQPLVAVEETPLSSQDEQIGRQVETATLIALILLFIIVAIIPGYKAFALSMQDSAVGSIGDADFWYLIQSSIMAVMGNVIMVVPLLKKSWFSPAYGLMWGFFALGLAFAIVAVIIYPLLNPGWSYMVAFFGSIASVASVLIMTQATAREETKAKVKTD
ncbi:hypothetical protein COCC4DRAFT_135016 [Bipolaris maydis ATCC 48331]|uniref:Uncharacterized protein n=2 Tax=Cochliobolus heterostrophus TaxID=5016 RepID=M2UEB3_COCH5|nr:uncharacterized protein COCC4DRAFT_135016 [Bipolaris maydis ATCC 48331]EMD86328.1 hypothetical protein COCHEDRAFT_1207327 [Bipolaris maydis C5]KAH7551760.1 hypothetical protein BM1_09394 [Bipolaris maydis]ENI06275.1 hypothetical protein COCC4DRAFT_135016 [Bipolaris maydis ATCC 48331]KAJ5065007.1 hypothetical protein J3E74DRAFT_414075 [Bipolaris maydis]KAJ6213953.1 hypothetical protein PSV09DRAFT_1207327 [Bipolaris maydis]